MSPAGAGLAPQVVILSLSKGAKTNLPNIFLLC
jgi:hypothetical protein